MNPLRTVLPPTANPPTPKTPFQTVNQAQRTPEPALPPRTQEIETLIVERVADILGLEPSEIDPTAAHANYGLDSASAVLIAAELEEELMVPLPDSLAWDHPTLRGLAHFIAKLEVSQ